MRLATTLLLILILTILPGTSVSAQTIVPAEGYTTQVGTLVSMLDDLKSRITRMVQNMDQDQTDFLLDESANRIGAMVLHLAATEKNYQLYCFEGRLLQASDGEEWNAAMQLGDAGRKLLVDKPMSYYLEKWDEVRAETKRLLAEKDDAWLYSVDPAPNSDMNMHWAWYHVMEHQSNHMGQMALLRGRM